MLRVCVRVFIAVFRTGRGSSQVSLSGTALPWGCADARELTDRTQLATAGEKRMRRTAIRCRKDFMRER